MGLFGGTGGGSTQVGIFMSDVTQDELDLEDEIGALELLRNTDGWRLIQRECTLSVNGYMNTLAETSARPDNVHVLSGIQAKISLLKNIVEGRRGAGDDLLSAMIRERRDAKVAMEHARANEDRQARGEEEAKAVPEMVAGRARGGRLPV